VPGPVDGRVRAGPGDGIEGGSPGMRDGGWVGRLSRDVGGERVRWSVAWRGGGDRGAARVAMQAVWCVWAAVVSPLVPSRASTNCGCRAAPNARVRNV
jgi:hypothetical protein